MVVLNVTSNNRFYSQPILTISQLLKYNSVKKPRETSVVRHTRERETPLPIYIGLKIHSVTRSRELIDNLFSLGISVSYDRVLQLSTDLTNNACARFESLGAVVPAKLCTGVFTTSAIDNIDHDPSSTSANSSFHGTGISIFQHPTDNQELQTVTVNETPTIHARNSRLADLPDFYSNIPPVILNPSAAPPSIQSGHKPHHIDRAHRFDEAKDVEMQ